MGGFLSKDVMDKIDDYIVNPEECDDIEATIDSQVNQSIGVITDKLRKRYDPSVNTLRTNVSNYLNILKYAGIVYIILFVLMMLIQFIIVILLLRNKNL